MELQTKARSISTIRFRIESFFHNIRLFKKISADLDSLTTLTSMKDQTSFTQQNNHKLRVININFKGKKFHLTLRNYSSDLFILKEIFLNECYALPQNVKPDGGTILDIGANIGLASLYLHATFPDALIYAFEPFEENYQLLEKNVLFDNSKIKPVKMALSDHTGESFYLPSLDNSNFGGGDLGYGIDPDSLYHSIRLLRNALH
jgi:hypothetical protein